MRIKFKTRGEAVAAYADAFREDPKNRKAAEILYGTLEVLHSSNMDREWKILCLAEEIDHMICGNIDARKGGGKE